jgi:dolichyl-phosphate beta-glucosyltransferase
MIENSTCSTLLVVPCFNEELRLNIPEWRATLLEFPNVTWLFVNDGSTDKTWNLLNELNGLQNILLLNLKNNVGKAESIRVGMLNEIKNSSYQIVGFVDSDRAFSNTDISEMLSFIQSHEEFNAVISARVGLLGRNIERSNFRHYIGRILATYIGLGSRDFPYDSQSGFKLFRNEPALVVSLQPIFLTRWYFDVELILRLTKDKNNQYLIWEFPIREWKDVAGSKINMSQTLRILREIFTVRQLVQSHTKSIR